MQHTVEPGDFEVIDFIPGVQARLLGTGETIKSEKKGKGTIFTMLKSSIKMDQTVAIVLKIIN